MSTQGRTEENRGTLKKYTAVDLNSPAQLNSYTTSQITANWAVSMFTGLDSQCQTIISCMSSYCLSTLCSIQATRGKRMHI